MPFIFTKREKRGLRSLIDFLNASEQTWYEKIWISDKYAANVLVKLLNNQPLDFLEYNTLPVLSSRVDRWNIDQDTKVLTLGAIDRVASEYRGDEARLEAHRRGEEVRQEEARRIEERRVERQAARERLAAQARAEAARPQMGEPVVDQSRERVDQARTGRRKGKDKAQADPSAPATVAGPATSAPAAAAAAAAPSREMAAPAKTGRQQGRGKGKVPADPSAPTPVTAPSAPAAAAGPATSAPVAISAAPSREAAVPAKTSRHQRRGKDKIPADPSVPAPVASPAALAPVAVSVAPATVAALGNPAPAPESSPEDCLTVALVSAVRDSRKEVVSFLVAAGADIKAKDKSGSSALMLAAADGDLDMLALLRTTTCTAAPESLPGERLTDALVSAVRGGRKDVVSFLVAAGADIKAKDKSGSSALMLAATDGDLDMLAILTGKHDTKPAAHAVVPVAFFTVQYDNQLLNTFEGRAILQRAYKLGKLGDAMTKFCLNNKALPYAELLATATGIVTEAEEMKQQGREVDHAVIALLAGVEVASTTSTEAAQETPALTPALHLNPHALLINKFGDVLNLFQWSASLAQTSLVQLIDHVWNVVYSAPNISSNTTDHLLMLAYSLNEKFAPPVIPFGHHGGGDHGGNGGPSGGGDGSLGEAASGFGLPIGAMNGTTYSNYQIPGSVAE